MTNSTLPSPHQRTQAVGGNPALDGLVTLQVLCSLNLSQSDSKALIGVLNERALALPTPSESSLPTSQVASPDLIGQSGENPVTVTVTAPGTPASISETSINSPAIALLILDNEDTRDPIIFNTSPLKALPTLSVIQPGDPIYGDARAALADGCVLIQYRNKFYNLPSLPNPLPPFYCVTRGKYIGVFSGWDNASPKVQGVPRAIFSKVDSLEVGEDKVRKAIERGEANRV